MQTLIFTFLYIFQKLFKTNKNIATGETIKIICVKGKDIPNSYIIIQFIEVIVKLEN